MPKYYESDDFALDGETCIYCDTLLPRRYERDHFPIADCLGGTEIVKACLACHELKDRSPLSGWPADYALPLVMSIPRRALAVALAALGGHRHSLSLDLFDILEEWETVPTKARIVLAKLARAVTEVYLTDATSPWAMSLGFARSATANQRLDRLNKADRLAPVVRY